MTPTRSGTDAPHTDAAVLYGPASAPDNVLFLGAFSPGDIGQGTDKLLLWLEHDLRDWFGPRIERVVAASSAV